jgi:hypothetical protein
LTQIKKIVFRSGYKVKRRCRRFPTCNPKRKWGLSSPPVLSVFLYLLHSFRVWFYIFSSRFECSFTLKHSSNSFLWRSLLNWSIPSLSEKSKTIESLTLVSSVVFTSYPLVSSVVFTSFLLVSSVVFTSFPLVSSVVSLLF